MANLYKRNGRWYIRYDAPPGLDGKRKQKMESCGSMNKKQAEALLRQRLHDIDNGMYVDKSAVTYAEFLDTWIERLRKNQKSPTTICGYRGCINKHIRPALGHYLLDKLKPHIIQSFYDTLIDKGLSPKTISNIHGVIHSSLNHAVLLQMISHNYAGSVILPKRVDPNISTASVEQLAALLAEAKGTRYWIPCLIALFAGMRRSEIIGLQWQDVDTTAKTIYITRAVVVVDGTMYIKGTKSGKPRLITVSDVLIDALKEHRKKQITREISTPWVCAKLNGEVMNPSTLGNWFLETRKKLNLSFTMHGLRHTYVTEAISRGATLKAVSDMAGHATEGFTLRKYTHTTSSMQNAVVNAIDSFFLEAREIAEKVS